MLQSVKPRPCKVCKAPGRKFGLSYFCDYEHAAQWGQDRAERTRAREERRLDRERRAKLKTRGEWIAEAQKAFNAFIRKRDEGKPCICCDRTETQVDGLSAHGWDAGHYRSTGSAPHLRFDERNVHRQLVRCNRYGAGRAVDYRLGLIKRIGLLEVESLESDQSSPKWTIEDLKAIRLKYKLKLKELQNVG